MRKNTKKSAMDILIIDEALVGFEILGNVSLEDIKKYSDKDWMGDEEYDIDRYESYYTWALVSGLIDEDVIPSVDDFSIQLKELHSGKIGMFFLVGSDVLMEMPFDDIPFFVKRGERYCGTVYEPYSYSYMGDDEFLIFDYKDYTYVMKCEPHNGFNRKLIWAFKTPKETYYKELNRMHDHLGVEPVSSQEV